MPGSWNVMLFSPSSAFVASFGVNVYTTVSLVFDVFALNVTIGFGLSSVISTVCSNPPTKLISGFATVISTSLVYICEFP